jgi:hypothetical protein
MNVVEKYYEYDRTTVVLSLSCKPSIAGVYDLVVCGDAQERVGVRTQSYARFRLNLNADHERAVLKILPKH